MEPHMPATKPLGRPRETALRAVLDAILYMARTGCQWRMLPKDFPPFTTVQGYFYDWRDNGLFEKINFELLPRFEHLEDNNYVLAVEIELEHVARSAPDHPQFVGRRAKELLLKIAADRRERDDEPDMEDIKLGAGAIEETSRRRTR
jgi:transposase